MTRVRIALGLLLGLLLSSAAHATPIQFAFSAVVTEVIDPTGAIAASPTLHPSLGDPITGLYSFDSEAPPSYVSTGIRYYEMRNEISWMSFEVGGVAFRTRALIDGGYLQINVIDDWPNAGGELIDLYTVFSGVSDAGGSWVASAHIDAISKLNLDVLNGTDLPTTPPDFSKFENVRNFRLHVLDGIVYGRIESVALVPEPGTAALLAFGLLGLQALARRR